MTPITKIALRRIANKWRKALLPALALTFSMMMISFILFFDIQTKLIPSAADSLPFGNFLSDIRICMRTTATVLSFITFLTVRVHSSMKRDELTHTLAVLTSIGASSKQKNSLIRFQRKNVRMVRCRLWQVLLSLFQSHLHHSSGQQ